ncbi:sulfotransferase family protein [Xenococcus sp. PCC 7305]|uniref:sulfotransferase family protein n=1 Tax=Xenococcus sp. PCC 7305 TaxID=102125 RepID=UPI0005942A2F|nr:sulfotransferase family protein [Xenococcus sp. PCC 7305]
MNKIVENKSLSFIEQAKVLEKQNKIDEAILFYQKAVELEPKQPFWIYKRLGDLLRQNARLVDSIAACQKAIELKPDNGNLYYSLGASYRKLGDEQKAFINYQKAVELNPEQPFWVYKELGDFFLQEDKLEEAISAYQKVLELNSDNSARLYLNMGEAFSKQKQWEKAINVYQKALSIDPYLGERIHFSIRHAQLQQGQIIKASISYQNAIKRRYLINHKYKIVYCPIPKNACSLIKTTIVEHSHDRDRYKKSNQDIHSYTYINDKGVSLNDISYLNNPEYFKFVVLRNPFNRLVSAYIEKIARRKNPVLFVKDVIKDVYKFSGLEPDIEKSITFSQFIHYLARTEDIYLNQHWRPQYTFLGEGLFKFDFIGQFEKLDSVISCLEQKFHLNIETSTTKHITDYCVFDDHETFHDKYPAYLRSLDGFPKAHHFYTSELEELVRKKYAEDIRIYEKEFNTTLSIL